MHLTLVIGSGLLTIAGMVALGFQLQLVEVWSALAADSITSAIISLLLVAISGILAQAHGDLLGRLGVHPARDGDATLLPALFPVILLWGAQAFISKVTREISTVLQGFVF